MKRRILVTNIKEKKWYFETLYTDTISKNSREEYLLLSGETICQYLLRKHPISKDGEIIVISRGPLPFLSGNKTTIGYISPLTGLPHYSFVGGNAACQLFNLGLDAILLTKPIKNTNYKKTDSFYIVIEGKAPDISVKFKKANKLPEGQRSAYYWLVSSELNSQAERGSVFTIGDGAYLDYRSANIAVEAIYHAGRGGAGYIFKKFCSAIILKGLPVEISRFFTGKKKYFGTEPIRQEIDNLLNNYCDRLSSPTGGTIRKFYSTGSYKNKKVTLPSQNARSLGYQFADLGSPRLLKATRGGKAACQWCRIACRHWHYIPVNYTPKGKDIFLDDFEPAYAIYSMLDLAPLENTNKAQKYLFDTVNKHIFMPIEEMGCDVINIGLALSALFEGIQKGFIPLEDVPPFITQTNGLNKLDMAIKSVDLLKTGQIKSYPALRAAGDGPQALSQKYKGMKDIVFNCGNGTLGNAGHCNALWTFLMPFSRFFGHYSGQIYKIEEPLPPPGSSDEEYTLCFQKVIKRMLNREFFWIIGSALSQCSFTFIIFSQDGKGEALSEDLLLVRLLEHFDIFTTNEELNWFSQTYWAQSIDLKCQMGWKPPLSSDFPLRVFELLSIALNLPVKRLKVLMDILIKIWKKQAGEILNRFGYDIPWK